MIANASKRCIGTGRREGSPKHRFGGAGTRCGAEEPALIGACSTLPARIPNQIMQRSG